MSSELSLESIEKLLSAKLQPLSHHGKLEEAVNSLTFLSKKYDDLIGKSTIQEKT